MTTPTFKKDNLTDLVENLAQNKPVPNGGNNPTQSPAATPVTTPTPQPQKPPPNLEDRQVLGNNDEVITLNLDKQNTFEK